MLQFVANAIVAGGVREFNTHTRWHPNQTTGDIQYWIASADSSGAIVHRSARQDHRAPGGKRCETCEGTHTMDAIIDFKVVWLAESHVAVPGAKCRIEKLE